MPAGAWGDENRKPYSYEGRNAKIPYKKGCAHFDSTSGGILWFQSTAREAAAALVCVKADTLCCHGDAATLCVNHQHNKAPIFVSPTATVGICSRSPHQAACRGDLNMSTPRDPPAREAGAAARPPDQVCKELADVFEKEVLPRLDSAVRPGR